METYHSDIIECFIWDLQETSQRLTNGTSRIRTTEMSWWRTTETSLVVSFQICLRRRGDALMGRRCYVILRRCFDVPIKCRGDVPLRCPGDVPQRRRWVFHLRRNSDVAGTYRETSLRSCYDVLLPGGLLTSWKIDKNVTELSLRESPEKYGIRISDFKLKLETQFFITLKQKYVFFQIIKKYWLPYWKYSYSGTWWDSILKFCKPYQEVI